MKKSLISALLVLLLIISLPAAAFADVIYPAPGNVEAGSYMNHLIAELTPGCQVSASGLPEGVSLAEEPGEELTQVYLRGTPTTAGTYSAIINVDGNSTICTFTVTPAVPQLTVSEDLRCYTGQFIQLSVSAVAWDKGSLSYQWYVSTDEDTGSGLPISGATGSLYLPGTGQIGHFFYYCVVTNTSGGMSVSATSPMITVVVEELAADSIQVETMPTKLRYRVGDRLDPAGLSLRVQLSDGNSRILTEGFSLEPFQLEAAGIQTIQVSYAGKTCSFQVQVDPAEEIIEGIGVLTLPTKTSYEVGEELNASGLGIRVYTNNGHRDVFDELICTPTKLEHEGNQTITVHYREKTCTFSVTVRAKDKAESLSVSRLPDKLRYQKGEALDTAGLILTQTDSSGHTEEIKEGFVCAPTRLDKAGEQEILVTYGTLSCRFTVQVEEKPAPTPSPTPTPEPTPEPTPAATQPPAPTPSPRPTYDSNLGRNLAGVIVGASVLALLVLGGYVFVMNRGGLDLFLDQLKERFKKK